MYIFVELHHQLRMVQTDLERFSPFCCRSDGSRMQFVLSIFMSEFVVFSTKMLLEMTKSGNIFYYQTANVSMGNLSVTGMQKMGR